MNLTLRFQQFLSPHLSRVARSDPRGHLKQEVQLADLTVHAPLLRQQDISREGTRTKTVKSGMAKNVEHYRRQILAHKSTPWLCHSCVQRDYLGVGWASGNRCMLGS
ncbi:hypothetical protein CDAR_221631 [Caerostris darwini]|uniref:Uncharacterized protein n=1 Tax=Caerostris darwini TaxID=1538125 RepID=A0AAV4WPR7_9ARAC|nr:hypothetical protein CDAR_221631 [Caerostris darwini]